MADNTLVEDDDLDTKSKVEDELVITETDPSTKKAEDSDEDERLTNKEDPEREVIRERRRIEKLERKERRDKAMTRDKVELDFLRKRNDDLEKRFSSIEQRQHSADLNQVDVRLREALNEVDMAEKVIAKAVEAGNGSDVTQAMRYRDQAMQKAAQLNQAKQNAAQQPRKAEGMDDRVMAHAQEFLEDNSWYDPQGRDEDSAIVLAIDQTLVRDGYDPKSEDYWDELRYRAGRRLPERFGEKKPVRKEEPKEPAREARGGPSIGSGREHAPSSTRREIYISPERKQALVEAGVWDDPVLRQKYVKQYQRYDAQNKA